MSEFQRWSSQHRTIRASRDWNALLDHGLEKTASYVIRKNGSYYEAINGSTGKIDYGGQNNAGGVDGTDAAAVIQAAVDTLTNGGKILIKKGKYDINSRIEIRSEGLIFEGEGASDSGVTIFNVTNDTIGDAILWNPDDSSSYATFVFKNFRIDGNDLGVNGLSIYGGGDPFLIENVYVVNCNAALNLLGVGKGLVKRVVGKSSTYGLFLGNSPVRGKLVSEVLFERCVFNLNEYGIYGDFPSQQYQFLTWLAVTVEANNIMGAYFNNVANHYWMGCHFEQNNWDGVGTSYSLYYQQTVGTSSSIQISQTEFLEPKVDRDIYIEKAFRVVLNNVEQSNSSQILQLTNGKHVKIIGGHIRGLDFDNMKYVEISAAGTLDGSVNIDANCDYITFRNCEFQATPTVAAGAGVRAIDCSGYVTANSGTAIIPADTKSHQVAFELAGTPTVVKITPQFDVSGRWWISNLTWASGTSILSGAFTFNRTYSGLYSGIIHWNAEYIP
ncbi:MAG: hypothetical protein ACTSPB_20460 [Candidatus Thorarchaeota archaeon]